MPFVPRMLRPETLQAVLGASPGALLIELDPDDPTAYARALVRAWSTGLTFVVVEQDIVPPPGAIHRLSTCADAWCVHAYPVSGRVWWPMLGLAKFDAEIMRDFPNLAHAALWYRKGKREWAHWRSCNELLAFDLTARGLEPHRHLPDAAHLHEYPERASS